MIVDPIPTALVRYTDGRLAYHRVVDLRDWEPASIAVRRETPRRRA